jgi:transcription elongation factor GreB
MSYEKNYITPQGLALLREEYARLLHEERPKTVDIVSWAASNGDRSENADYIYGKRRLREIDSRLGYLQSRLEKVCVVDPEEISTERVVFACWVTLAVDTEEETEIEAEAESGEQILQYQIVGVDEFDVKKKQISWKSPLARALLGKKVGDRISFQAPGGRIEADIMKISKVKNEK